MSLVFIISCILGKRGDRYIDICVFVEFCRLGQVSLGFFKSFFQTSNISVICVLQINQRFFQLFFQRIDIKTGDFRRIVNHLNI